MHAVAVHQRAEPQRCSPAGRPAWLMVLYQTPPAPMEDTAVGVCRRVVASPCRSYCRAGGLVHVYSTACMVHSVCSLDTIDIHTADDKAGRRR